MMPATLPDLRKLGSALRTTTELLANELAHPSSVAPRWSPLEWDVARATAAMQGISMLLARRLPWQGPPRWQEFLREQVTHATLRDLRIDALVAQLDAELRRAGVPAVALKGAALRRLSIYETGDRPRGDIDLLAQPCDFPAVTRALAAIGYHESYAVPRHTVFNNELAQLPKGGGEHIDNPIKIELHPRISDPLPVTHVDITAWLTPGPLEPGLHGYATLAALVAHVLLHAAGNMRAHALRLIQLEDIARLTRRMNPRDWSQLLEIRADGHPPWWMLPPLVLAERYCSATLPGDARETLRAACSRTLARAAHRQTLTEVSWSNLRIAAFPGLEWSRSVGEALRFMHTRLLPSRAALDELAAGVRTSPQLQTLPWYGLAHGKRIMRWVTGRAPRVQTLTSVMAALAGPTPCQRD